MTFTSLFACQIRLQLCGTKVACNFPAHYSHDATQHFRAFSKKGYGSTWALARLACNPQNPPNLRTHRSAATALT